MFADVEGRSCGRDRDCCGNSAAGGAGECKEDHASRGVGKAAAAAYGAGNVTVVAPGEVREAGAGREGVAMPGGSCEND
jgi:hypothetical protein